MVSNRGKHYKYFYEKCSEGIDILLNSYDKDSNTSYIIIIKNVYILNGKNIKMKKEIRIHY